MGKYDRFNKVVPLGCGYRKELVGLGAFEKVTCYRCDGTGIDKFGAHCTACQNNRKKWRDRNNMDLID